MFSKGVISALTSPAARELSGSTIAYISVHPTDGRWGGSVVKLSSTSTGTMLGQIRCTGTVILASPSPN